VSSGPRAMPHLAMHATAPNEIWFTLPASGQIGRLTVGADLTAVGLSHYTVPVDLPEPHDIALQSSTRVWITVPNQARLYQLQVGTGRFYAVATGAGSQPWSLSLDDGSPWFTDIAGNRVGNWNPSTLSIVVWRTLPREGSVPHDLAVHGGYVWFSEQAGHRLGRFSTSSYRAIEETGLPGGSPSPTGVSVDASGAVWVAAPGTNQLLRWQPPYFRWLHIPLVTR